MRIEKVSFTSQGQTVAGVLHLPDLHKPPCVIASHGLFSSKDSEKYIVLGERSSRRGLAFLRFDFRGFGESGGTVSESTVSGRLGDLNVAIEFVKSHSRIGAPVGLMGSSLGGYISLLTAATRDDIRAVVTWATPFTLAGLAERRGEGEMTSLGEDFFNDINAHNLALNLPKVPNCLVVHGDRDELVPAEHAQMIYQGLKEPKRVEIIEGGDHLLTRPEHREKAIEMTLEWFERYFEP
jgi:alpha-beta hydrolase superfamily lysophospholipase